MISRGRRVARAPDRVEVGQGQSTTSPCLCLRAASSPKAVIAAFALKVSNGASAMSFDHLVGCCQKRPRNADTE